MKKSKDKRTSTGITLGAVDDFSLPNPEESFVESGSSTYEETRMSDDIQGSSSVQHVRIVEPPESGDNRGMNIFRTLFKNEIVQALSLVAAVVGLAIAAVQFFGAQFDAIKTTLEANEVRAEARYDKLINKIDEMDRRYELRQSEAEKRATLYQEQTDRYIDAKTGKR